MPRVSLPAAPASERKHGVCATNFSGSASAARICSRTRLVTGTSAVGIEVEALLAAHREQVLLELRQLPGADERAALHQVRHVDFGVAVLARVQVEHELCQRAVQTRDLRAHAPRSAPRRCAPRPSKSSAAQVLAQVDVIARLEGEAARLAPAAHLEVGALVPPSGTESCSRLGSPSCHCSSSSWTARSSRLRLGERAVRLSPLAMRAATSSPRPLAMPTALALALRSARRRSSLHLPGLALVLRRLQRRHIKLEAAAREVARHAFRVGAQQLRIDHVVQPFDSLRARRRASASPILISSPRGRAGSIADPAASPAGSARPAAKASGSSCA